MTTKKIYPKPLKDKTVEELVPKELLSLACKKIRYQFPRTAEGQLHYMVVEACIKDLANPRDPHYGSAKSYLSGDMIHAELCGVSPIWIRRVINQVGNRVGVYI